MSIDKKGSTSLEQLLAAVCCAIFLILLFAIMHIREPLSHYDYVMQQSTTPLEQLEIDIITGKVTVKTDSEPDFTY